MPLIGVPFRLRTLSIFGTFNNMLKLPTSPQAKRAETDPRQGTPTRAHFQPPEYPKALGRRASRIVSGGYTLLYSILSILYTLYTLYSLYSILYTLCTPYSVLCAILRARARRPLRARPRPRPRAGRRPERPASSVSGSVSELCSRLSSELRLWICVVACSVLPRKENRANTNT